MEHKKLALIALAILMVAGAASVSAYATDGSSPGSIELVGSPELPLSGSYSQAVAVQVQEIAQAAPAWEQGNSNGFGDPGTVEVTALEAFNGYLYAGTFNPIDPALLYDGGQIFRSADGMAWNPVTQPGFGNSHDIAPPAILDFVVFNNQLYAGTGRGNASQIWRTSNGTIWAPMDVTGFSDPDNVDITALAVYGGMIYAGVRNQVSGAQIWRSFTGDNNTWTQIAPQTPGTSPASVTGFAAFTFDGGLYAAVESEEAPAQIWRSYGSDWEIVVNDGFGDANTLLTGGMAEFGGHLYVGVGNTATGAQLWRTNDSVTWEQAITPGFGDPNNKLVEMVFVFQNQLYAGLQNAATGIEIWRSADGTIWEQANLDGFGDSNNSTTNGSNATTDFLGQLYVGTSNHILALDLPSIFVDVPDNNWAVSYIERLYNAGITGGCIQIPLQYCPDNTVTRDQMAVFLLKGIHGSSFSPPPVGGSTSFNDVPSGYWSAAWIEQLAAEGITGGCGNGNYCPDSPVTRAQMAVFLLKSNHGVGFTPPPATGTKFNDVLPDHWAAAWIEQLANEGITGGCGNNNYCPDNPVTRAQMAVFLVKTFNLP